MGMRKSEGPPSAPAVGKRPPSPVKRTPVPQSFVRGLVQPGLRAFARAMAELLWKDLKRDQGEGSQE